jgi:hypothetical protein
MDSRKNTRIQPKTLNRKKFYIFIIIFILFASTFPPLSNADTPTVGSHLSIAAVLTSPDPAVEDDTVHIYVTIQNIGSHNISAGEHIIIYVTVDNETSSATSLDDSLGLVKNQQRKENLTWVATVGSSLQRLLHITVTYSGSTEAIAEREIRVSQRQTDLLFFSTPTISGMSQIGKPITITALVKNSGKNTTKLINVSLRVDTILKGWYVQTDGLIKGESFSVSFSWTPLTFGIHRINLSIDPNHTITEESKTNNYYETTTSVIPWWNTSWHYRRVYNITGVGNVSFSINFTTLLKSLQIVNKTFDNTTISVVRYYSNGTMGVINKILFNESSKFHNRTNAAGTLTFTVPGSSLYGVYFDVKENRGTRRPTAETKNLTASGTVYASVVSTQGWWPEFVTPFETYYELNKKITVEVVTRALAKNITARFVRDGDAEFNMTLSTGNYLDWSNTTKALSERGNWTVQVVGYDDAGYRTPTLTASFYIGKPDLVITALSVQDYSYVGYDSTVIAHIRAFNTTVENVNVSLRVDNENASIPLRNLTIQKNENRTLQFTWVPSSKGLHNISVVIFYPDSNTGNNKKWKVVNVEGVPDLGVVNISVSPIPVDEGDPVTITTYIGNTGDGNASGYTVVLYCEQNENNHTMYFIAERNSTKVNLKKNEYTNVSLTWDETRYGLASFNGEWAVGIQILNSTLTPDKYGVNNTKTLFHVLRVNPSERIPPFLSNLEYPSSIELGNQVLIRVKATDASGIASVVLSIKTPEKTFVNATMVAVADNRYEYLFDPVSLGRYNFSIKATDLSINKNQSTITGFFQVTGDKTPPAISYFGALPLVQLKGDQVEIRCIATDLSGIRSVDVTVVTPENLSETHVMRNASSDAKYTYTKAYDRIGKYTFVITVKDIIGNVAETEEKTFWITDDLSDTDADGMPDTWETRYGLNPFDSSDASLDLDDDGVSNLEEYTAGSNPTKKISSASEFFVRLKDNWAYLLASIGICVVIVCLAYYGIRRKRL